MTPARSWPRLFPLACWAALIAALAWLPTATLTAALALAAAAAAAGAILRRPAIGLALAAVGVPFGRLGPPDLAGLATPALLLLAAAGAAARAGVRPTTRAPWRPLDVALGAAFGLYLAAHAAAAWRAPDLAAAAAESARWFELALAALTAAALARPGDRRLVVAALLVVGGIVAVAGGGLALAGYGPEAFAVAGRGFTRAHWPFGQPNPFGGYLNLVWPLGAACAVVGLPRRGARALGALGAVCAALALAALGLSWSRGAWLAAASGAALMAGAWLTGGPRAPRPGRVALAGAALGLVLAATLAGAPAAPASVVDRLASIVAADGASTAAPRTPLGLPDVRDAEVTDASFSTVERLAHWQAAAAMWSDRPWLGQGPGHFALAYPRFHLGRWRDALGHAHNYYLHALAETGLVGLATYAAALALALAMALATGRAPRSPLASAVGLGLAGALGATAVHSLFDNLWVHELPVQVGLLVGLALAERRDAAAALTPREPAR